MCLTRTMCACWAKDCAVCSVHVCVCVCVCVCVYTEQCVDGCTYAVKCVDGVCDED